MQYIIQAHSAGHDRLRPPPWTRLTSGFLCLAFVVVVVEDIVVDVVIVVVVEDIVVVVVEDSVVVGIVLVVEDIVVDSPPQVLSSHLTAVTSGEPETPPLPRRSPPRQTTDG